MPTIADVAKLAGLSRATVSRVINNHPYVSEEKKKLVREAMDALNFYPNSSAQKLRSQKTETIAVFVPLLTNPFFAYLLEGIDTVAHDYGYQLLVCQTRYDKEKELNFLRLLKTKQVDGIILTSIENNWEKIKNFTECGPIILCNEYDDQAKIPSVRLDQEYGGYIGTRHFIEKGYTKIAYCRGFCRDQFVSRISAEREVGYKRALSEFGLKNRKEWVFENVSDVESGRQVLRKILLLKDPPTAVFTGSDQVAAGIINEAATCGLRVPEDIAVIGFDNQPIAEITVPPITTIMQPMQEIGQQAGKLLMDVIEKKDQKDVEDILLSLHLIERAST
ncbi:LacI family DNA-binding transcriptional regulator [Niallia nealsonii]|uniref:LacI family transcriptional regulator n=1 Tax=Niallia nealsonii TaxID=115979 RepID=A0A2N0Z0F2_9BACI|nr:LacI family DNA-binding transcriptional regulator [Niallia nealsonii]PKG22985.1 LacI family transcriptional regulator [Niallia nealsonii]